MARKVSGPAESNTGLVVTLVFFVLATLTLGVFTYLGYSGQLDYQEKAKKSDSDAKAAKKATDEEAVRRLVIAIGTGNEQPGDQQKLNGLKGANKGEFDKAVAALKDVEKWDPNTDRPALTLSDKIAKMTKDLATAINEKKLAEQKRDEAEKALASERSSFNDNQAKSKASLEEAQAKALAELKGSQDAYINLITKLENELSVGLKNERQGREDDGTAAEREKKKLKEDIMSKAEQLAKALAQLTPPNSLEADTPKGSIIKVDRANKTVYLNLGSADYLKPQVTFSIWGAGTSGRSAANRDPKGRVEVINVLEPHLAVARIVATTNELRDPVLPGDLLFNPSWNSSQREHVALAGIFDLDGDGFDDTPELIRNLERQGVIVDAWLDFGSRKVMGAGITERTSYIVAGEKPALPEAMSRQASQLGENKIVAAFQEINVALANMEQTAQQKGVQKVAYRRYLTLVGYPLPKLTRPLDLTASTYTQRSVAAVSGGEPANKANDNKMDKSKEAKPKDDKPADDKPKADMPKEEKKDE